MIILKIVGIIVFGLIICTLAICITVFYMKASQLEYEIRMHEIDTNAVLKQQEIEQKMRKKQKD